MKYLILLFFLFYFHGFYKAQTILQIRQNFKNETVLEKKSYYAFLIVLKDVSNTEKYTSFLKEKSKKNEFSRKILKASELILSVLNHSTNVSIKEIQQIRTYFKAKKYISICDNLDVCEAYAYALSGNYAVASLKYKASYTSIKAKYFKNKSNFIDRENYYLVVMSIGYHYFDVGDNEKTHDYLEELLNDTEIKKDHEQYLIALCNVGTVYLEEDIDDKALKYFQEAQKIANLHGFEEWKNWTRLCISFVYWSSKRFEDSEKELNKLTYTVKNGEISYNDLSSAVVNLYKARNELHFGRDEAGFSYLNKIDPSISNEIGFNSFNRETYKNLYYEYYKRKNQFETALKWHEKYKDQVLKNKAFIEKNKRAIQKSFLDFEKRRISILEKEKSQKELSQQKLKVQYVLTFSMFILAIILAFFVHRQLKLNKRLVSLIKENKLKNQQIKESLTEKEILLSEIHHRVKNNFQIISSLFNIQSDSLNSPDQIAYLIEAKNRVHSMSLVHQKLYAKKSFSTIEFGDYILDLIDSLVINFGFNSEHIEVRSTLEEINISLDKAVPFGLLCNEVLTNCFKYGLDDSQKLVLNITLQLRNSTEIFLQIKDHGKGFNEQTKKPESVGNKLVDVLTQQIDGEVKRFNNLGAVVEIVTQLND